MGVFQEIDKTRKVIKTIRHTNMYFRACYTGRSTLQNLKIKDGAKSLERQRDK